MVAYLASAVLRAVPVADRVIVHSQQCFLAQALLCLFQAGYRDGGLSITSLESTRPLADLYLVVMTRLW